MVQNPATVSLAVAVYDYIWSGALAVRYLVEILEEFGEVYSEAQIEEALGYLFGARLVYRRGSEFGTDPRSRAHALQQERHRITTLIRREITRHATP